MQDWQMAAARIETSIMERSVFKYRPAEELGMVMVRDMVLKADPRKGLAVDSVGAAIALDAAGASILLSNAGIPLPVANQIINEAKALRGWLEEQKFKLFFSGYKRLLELAASHAKATTSGIQSRCSYRTLAEMTSADQVDELIAECIRDCGGYIGDLGEEHRLDTPEAVAKNNWPIETEVAGFLAGRNKALRSEVTKAVAEGQLSLVRCKPLLDYPEPPPQRQLEPPATPSLFARLKQKITALF